MAHRVREPGDAIGGRLRSWLRTCDWAILVISLLVAALPFMMAAHIVLNHFLEPWLGWATPLTYPEVVAAITLAVLPTRRTTQVRGTSWRFLVVTAAVLGTWCAVAAIAQDAPIRYWGRRVAIEWVVGPILGLSFARHLNRSAWMTVRETWMWSSLVGVWTTIGLYVLSVGVPLSFKELVFDNRTYYLQFGLAQRIYFGELTFGGVNDIAIYYGIVALVYVSMLLDDQERWRWRTALLPGLLVLEYLCYSRGALLGLGGGVVLLSIIRRRRMAPWSATARLALGALAVFGACVIAPSGAIAYWRGQLTVEESSTAALRVRMWTGSLAAETSAAQAAENLPIELVTKMRQESQHATIATSEQPPPPAETEPSPSEASTPSSSPPDPEASSSAATPERSAALAAEALRTTVSDRVGGLGRRLVFGYGTGNYGLLAGATPDLGVHNLFLEAFVSSGIPGLTLFGLLWALFIWRTYAWGRQEATLAAWSAFAVALYLTFVGIFVSVRFENLGTFAIGTVFWLMAAGGYGSTEARLSPPAAKATPSTSQ